MELQQTLGCEVGWLEASEVSARWPIFDGPGYVGGTFGPLDGSIDPNAVLRGYRQQALAMGVEFIEGEVVELIREDDRISGVLLEAYELAESSAPNT